MQRSSIQTKKEGSICIERRKSLRQYPLCPVQRYVLKNSYRWNNIVFGERTTREKKGIDRLGLVAVTTQSTY